MNVGELDESLSHLAELLAQEDSRIWQLVVCGGSALIACGLVERVTKDVDVLALKEGEGMISPAPLPEVIVRQSLRVAEDLGLPADWLNNGPSSGPGGLFQVGLPTGLMERLNRKSYGSSLKVYYVGRLDQICFKLYAAVDQMGSYHGQDLAALAPTLEDLKFAIEWVKTQDSSAGFLEMLKLYLTSTGNEDAVHFI